MMGYGDFSHALFLWSTLQSQYYQGIEPKNTPKNANIGQHLIKHTIEPTIATLSHWIGKHTTNTTGELEKPPTPKMAKGYFAFRYQVWAQR